MMQLLPWNMTGFVKEEPTVQFLYYSPDNQEPPQYGKLYPFLYHLMVNLNNETQTSNPT